MCVRAWAWRARVRGCVCVYSGGFKWVKMRLASYYCLRSCSYIITVKYMMNTEDRIQRELKEKSERLDAKETEIL